MLQRSVKTNVLNGVRRACVRACDVRVCMYVCKFVYLCGMAYFANNNKLHYIATLLAAVCSSDQKPLSIIVGKVLFSVHLLPAHIIMSHYQYFYCISYYQYFCGILHIYMCSVSSEWICWQVISIISHARAVFLWHVTYSQFVVQYFFWVDLSASLISASGPKSGPALQIRMSMALLK